MSLFFTSDLHLDHKNIIAATNRPFSSLDEMESVLIDNINDAVRPNDLLYILGDLSFCHHKRADRIMDLCRAICCKHVTLILGNHDYRKCEYPFENVVDYASVRENHHSFKCMHYPMLTWENRTHGAYHVHGHIHSIGPSYNNKQRFDGLRRYDVGVDANGYGPVSAGAIVAFFDGIDGSDDTIHPYGV